MSPTIRPQRALCALGIAVLVLGCDHDPVAPAGTPAFPPLRPAASVATGPVLSLDSPEGSYSLDVLNRVLATPDGIAIPVEAEEMPELQAAFGMIASLDGPVTAIEYAPPPSGGCNELDASGCTPNATSLPVPGGTGSAAAAALGLEGVSTASATLAPDPDGSLRVRRTVTFGATTAGDGTSPEGGFSALLPGAFLGATTDGYAPSCSALFHAVRDFIPAYRAAVQVYRGVLLAVTAKAGGILKEQGRVINQTPIGERPSFGWMKALLERATSTWGTVGVIGAYELALANYKVHEAKMGFLVTMYNSYDCANRTTWSGGAGGDNAGSYDVGGGVITVICIFVDYYSNSGQYLRTEKFGCTMHMS